jgi:hypothetical protein
MCGLVDDRNTVVQQGQHDTDRDLTPTRIPTAGMETTDAPLGDFKGHKKYTGCTCLLIHYLGREL